MKLTITRPDGSAVCIEGTAEECEWFADRYAANTDGAAAPSDPPSEEEPEDGYPEFFRKTWLGARVRQWGVSSAYAIVADVRFVEGIGECLVDFVGRPRWLRAAVLEKVEDVPAGTDERATGR